MEIIKHLKQLGFKQSFIDDLNGWYQLENLSVTPPKGSEAESKGLKVGDTVRFKNDYGVCFYGSKIFAFLNVVHNGQDEQIIFIDNDSWWFPNITDQIRKHTKEDDFIHAAIQAARHASNARKFDKEEELCTLATKLEQRKIDVEAVKEALNDYDKANKTSFAI
ncbi:hypothetical protein PPW95_25370 (plasmid) [Vibrio parahaemolyticus]|uniref:hypothetical protein n=1 Tax=Vibrio harveyi group TaxID=717610 RepID=UPI00097181EA|nr:MULTISPECIES: hypothetical protein [Vibrio harveyi group]APX10068.1 hypothetical protein BWP24_28170 [Vibrio campbellii]WCP78835.1 hypothetical protein PPW95_25370 [Vibrio parahaemolyticus]